MKTNKILDYLFIIILINIIPSALLRLLNISNKLYMILYACAFIIQTMLLFSYFYGQKIKIEKRSLLALAVMLVAIVSSYLFCIIKLNVFFPEEIVVSISVILNILFLIIIPQKIHVQEKEITRFLEKITILGIVCCVLNIILNIDKLLIFSTLSGSYEANFSSIFPNRNTFGILMLICCISNQYLITRAQNKNTRISIQILFILNLILTMSRNSIAGLLLFYILKYAIGHFKYHKKSKTIYAIISIVICTLLIIATTITLKNQTIMNRIDLFFVRSDSLESGSGRFELWRNGYNIFKDNNPISGVGRYEAISINNNKYHNDLQYFHSLYIEVLAEYGLIGALLLFLLLVSIKKSINKSKLGKDYLTIIEATFYVFLAISVFESTTRFSIGYADTISLIYFATLPFLVGNATRKTKEISDIKTKHL